MVERNWLTSLLRPSQLQRMVLTRSNDQMKEFRERSNPVGSRFIDPGYPVEIWMLDKQPHRYYGTTHGITPDGYITILTWYLHGDRIK